MQTKSFVAVDMSRALSLIREEMGEDAMILSTQRTSKGIEIIATAEEMPTQTMTPQRSEPTLRKTSVMSQSLPVKGLSSGKTKEELALELELARKKMMAVKKENNVTLGEWGNQPTSVIPQSAKLQSGLTPSQPIPSQPIPSQPIPSQSIPSQPIPSQSIPSQPAQSELPQSQLDQWLQASKKPATINSDQKDNEEIRRLQTEIVMMRELFESQLSSMAEAQERRYQDQQVITDVMPIIADVKCRLSQLGLTQACNDQIIRSLRTIDTPSMNKEALWAESLARLSRNVPVITSDPVSTGGIYAFLGTTGVGKTTTIAKLAARYVIAHGSRDVALLTTDTFRIAGHDQLRSLARILNVKVKVVDDVKQLPKVLNEFNRQTLVLIDTPGMSYNDPLLKEHLTVLKQCQHVQNALVLSANSQYQMMQASIHSYRIAELRFCVMTKLDECANLGDAISVLATNNLPLGYITNGQAVPDDLAVIKAHQLVSKAVKLSKITTQFSVNQSQKSV